MATGERGFGGRGRDSRERRIFPRYSDAEDVDREIRAHLEERTTELVAEGWDPSAAREEALRTFGDVEAVAEQCRRIMTKHRKAVRRSRMLDALRQDIRFGLRTLMRSPGFALVAILTLALGIGANTAVFSVVNGVLLKPLPYDHPEELVWIREVSNTGGLMPVAWPNFVDWREQSTGFTGLALFSTFSTTVLGGQEPLTTSGAMVGQDFWKVFPVRPVEGRLTVPADHPPGSPPVVVVSRSFWQNELGGRPLEEYSLEIMGTVFHVVGVLPDRFDYPPGTSLWSPAEPFNTSESRTAHNWNVVGRMAAGSSLGRVREEIDGITKRGVAQAADEDPDYLAVGAATIPLADEMVGDVRRALLLLLAASGLVLLVACTNLSSTLLARGTARERELAVRASLGAGRGRIAGQLFTESILLAGIGGTAGVGLAYGVVRAVRAASPAFLPRLSEVALDGQVLVFTALIALATATLSGLLPARRMSRPDPADALRSGGRGNARSTRKGIWRFLVATEVALALVLLVGSGLLVRSFGTLLSVEPGFDARDVDVLSVSLSQLKYPEGGDHARFYEDFLQTLRSLPGVSAAGVLSSAPIQDWTPSGRVELDGDLQKTAQGAYVVASAGAFEALDIPLLQGRLFNPQDRPDAPHVAIVSRSFAQECWPGEDPIGKQVTGGGMDNFYRDRTFAEVVGVVGDVRFRDLARDPTPTIYFPYTQRPFRIVHGARVVVESSSGDPGVLVPSLRRALRAADPDVPVRIRPLEETVRESVGEQRFVMGVLGGFSLTALILAAVGIFGVVSYDVTRRTREMGIRLALGAAPGGVRRMVVRGAMGTVAMGLLAGTVGALLLSRALRSLLYEVSPADPLALAGALALLAVAAFLASWIPARQGTRVDPMVSMQSE